jgi:hypothetical protein
MTEQRIKIPAGYTIEITDGYIIIKKPPQKNNYITAHALINSKNLSKSQILNCEVKDGDHIVTTQRKFIKILIDVWKHIPHGKFKKSQFNFKEGDENGNNGYYWNTQLQLSVQHKSAQLTMKEIIHMVKINDLTIDFTIKLASGEIFTLELN